MERPFRPISGNRAMPHCYEPARTKLFCPSDETLHANRGLSRPHPVLPDATNTKPTRMKKLILTLFLVSGLAASAQTLVTAAEGGYLLDGEEAFYSGRLGWQFKANETYSHQLEVEVGYAETTEAGGRADILPVTLNYRLQSITTGNFGYYVGAGAGFARTRVAGVGIGGPVSLRDTSFAAQGFTGITYQASPAVALTLGAKYIWIDDVTLASTNVEIGDDVVVSAGISIKF